MGSLIPKWIETLQLGAGDSGISGKVGKGDGTTQKGGAAQEISLAAFAPSLTENVEELSEVKKSQVSSGRIAFILSNPWSQTINPLGWTLQVTDCFLTSIICCWQFHYEEGERCKFDLGASGAGHLSGFMRLWETIMHVLWAHSHF